MRRSHLIAIVVVAVVAVFAVVALARGNEKRAASPIHMRPEISCSRTYRPLVDAVGAIRGTVPAGPVAEYHRRVAAAQKIYDSIAYRTLDAGCVARVGWPAHEALRAYAAAGRGWTNGPAPTHAVRQWREADRRDKEVARGYEWALTVGG